MNPTGSILNTTREYMACNDDVIVGRSMLVSNELIPEV